MTTRGHLSEGRKRILAAEQDYKCAICQHQLPSCWQLDHKVPLHLGGSNHVENFQVLCGSCHDSKSQREMIEYHEAKRRERILRKRLNNKPSETNMSKFFDSNSESFIGTESFGDFLEKFRFVPASWST